MKILFLAVLILFLSLEKGVADVQFVEKRITTYPFLATPERSVAILTNYTQIRNGMTAKQVESVLGVPDEIRPLYEPKITQAKLIGYTHWYVLRRMKEHGSASEKNESLVRISFDNSGKVTRVDRW